jgi:hypothetical protein
MLLEDVVEIIELTDSDSLAQALERFNQQGMVAADMLPFMNVVFDKAPEQLCSRLAQSGFKGRPTLTLVGEKVPGRSYVVFDAEQFSSAEAQKWLTAQ